jgi:hypothetical protein
VSEKNCCRPPAFRELRIPVKSRANVSSRDEKLKNDWNARGMREYKYLAIGVSDKIAGLGR